MHGFDEVEPAAFCRVGNDIRKLSVGQLEETERLQAFLVVQKESVRGVTDIEDFRSVAVAWKKLFNHSFLEPIVRPR